MKIHFERSGGFSTMTNVAGEIQFNGNDAEVTSPGGGYKRALNTSEVEQLQNLAQPKPAQNSSSSGPGPVRDGFQYDITVTDKSGKEQKLAAAPPQLLQWVKEEADKILKHKMQQP